MTGLECWHWLASQMFTLVWTWNSGESGFALYRRSSNTGIRGSPKEAAKGILVDFPAVKPSGSSGTSATNKDIPGSSSPLLPITVEKTGPKYPTPALSTIEFSVFAWLNLRDKTSRGSFTIVAPKIQHQLVELDLKEIDEFLTNRTNLNERLNYQRCPTKRYRDIYSMLDEERNEITAESDTDERKRIKYETRVDVLNAAASIFQFFLPVSIEAPIISKFWGALHRVLKASVRTHLELLLPLILTKQGT